MPMTKFERIAHNIRLDPVCSDWLKSAVEALSHRDPVDAVNDADLLALIMRGRLDEITALHVNAPKV